MSVTFVEVAERVNKREVGKKRIWFAYLNLRGLLDSAFDAEFAELLEVDGSWTGSH